MHELSLAQSIVQLLEEQAIQQHFCRVKQVWMDIGALACVEVSALRFGLEVACVNTLAQDAQFHIRLKSATGWCMACSQPFTRTDYYLQCPQCGSGQVQIEGDDSMRVSELEVE